MRGNWRNSVLSGIAWTVISIMWILAFALLSLFLEE